VGNWEYERLRGVEGGGDGSGRREGEERKGQGSIGWAYNWRWDGKGALCQVYPLPLIEAIMPRIVLGVK
jgi:hypothetical protein